jgi:hypothetical protein
MQSRSNRGQIWAQCGGLSSCPAFPADPLPYIRRAVKQIDAFGLTKSQKLHYTQIDERDFLKVQSKLFAVALDLLFQFVNVLPLKAADQADRCFAMRRMLFNFQGWSHEKRCKPAANPTA